MDPIYFFLKIILRNFYKVDLREEERFFIKENMQKHRRILWLNICAGILIVLGLQSLPNDKTDLVVSALIAPVMVLGTAWFTISFGGIPQKLIAIAMTVTYWLFTAFSISLSAMFLAVGFAVSPFLWPVLVFIYIAALIACIQYDTADGLKVGLDDALLKHSRAALRYYYKQGIADE